MPSGALRGILPLLMGCGGNLRGPTKGNAFLLQEMGFTNRPFWRKTPGMGTATMTREEARKEIEHIRRVTREATATKESAKAFLVRLGFLTKSGKLPARYSKCFRSALVSS